MPGSLEQPCQTSSFLNIRSDLSLFGANPQGDYTYSTHKRSQSGPLEQLLWALRCHLLASILSDLSLLEQPRKATIPTLRTKGFKVALWSNSAGRCAPRLVGASEVVAESRSSQTVTK